MGNWLVTGGAGYIGAHVVRALSDAGLGAVAFDNLVYGRREFVAPGVPLVTADILDTEALEQALAQHECVGVIHLAGFKYAGESVRLPLHTYQQNVTGTESLLRAMQSQGVSNLVFSSSAGVYGTPTTEVVTEATPTNPESPYGESKLVGEWMIRAQVRATADSPAPLNATSLRYFNVVGSGPEGIFDVSPHNLFPKVFATLLAGGAPQINGDDYPTPDGTCIRDYVHVVDLARAHAAAATAFEAGAGSLEAIYNLGSGRGTSVREIVDAMREVTGIEFTAQVGPRRPGDPARIVARGDLAARDLGWANTFDVTQMVRTAWDATPR